MAAPRYIARLLGRFKMVAAIMTSAGAADAEKIVATNTGTGVLDHSIVNAVTSSAGAGSANQIPALDGSGRLDTTFMPVGVGADTKSVVSSENLAASDLVNLWNDGGTLKARKADATAEGKECHGFVLAGVTAPAAATVYFDGAITGLSGMTIGARQYLSAASPGARTETAPTTAGNVQQYVGVAVSATEMSFEPDDGVTIA
jgi:hypothetical protein